MLIGAAAAAAPDARTLFQDGEKALQAGDDLRAVADFEAAYAAQPAPSLLYWLGEAHFQAGHSAKAEDFFRKYLKAMPQGPKAAEAKARLVELKPAAPAKKTRVTVGEIEVKRKRKAMQMEEVKLAPARVAAKKKPTTSPATKTATATATQAVPQPPKDALVALKPMPAPAVAVAALPAVETAKPPQRPRRVGALIFGGAALAAAGGATYFALGARSAAGDVTAAAANHLPFDAERDAQGRRDQTIAAVCAGAAALALGVSIWLFAEGQ